MGVGVSCNFRHINNIWQIILYDVAYFGPHVQWQMLLPYVMADVIAIYEYLLADVCAIVDNIGKPFGCFKVGRCCCLEFIFLW